MARQRNPPVPPPIKKLLRRALVEVEPRDSTKPSRVWLQHRQRDRPVRVVELASVLRDARIPSLPDAA